MQKGMKRAEWRDQAGAAQDGVDGEEDAPGPTPETRDQRPETRDQRPETRKDETDAELPDATGRTA
jgi:hypothetical protein